MTRKLSKVPKGRVTVKKITGGYSINIKGRKFDETNNKSTANDKADRIRRLQGKA